MIAVFLFAALSGCSGPDEPPAEVPLPGDSLYRLEVDLEDQHGETIGLDVHRGHPTIVSMFYASCPMACPMLIGDVQAIEGRLTDAERRDLRVLLVSLDPANDTPQALESAVERHGVDDSRWALARPRPDDVRLVAATLGIAYREDGQGGMNHSSILTLVDALGRPQARLDGLQRDPTPMLEALRGL